ncbi:NAD(P)-binding protein [Xylariaceae sp. FL0016]|nr:NAD(P)-binding protein [Xylariaceae sp. FL0016]
MNMAGKLVLLTGGTGFVGHAILLDLLRSGYRVRVAARSQAKVDAVQAAPSIMALNPPETQLMFTIVSDMTVPGAYDDAVRDVDLIIHAAAPIHIDEDRSASKTLEQRQAAFVATAAQGNLGLLTSAHEKGHAVRRVVMTSSTTAIAPASIYTSAVGTEEHTVPRGPDTRVVVPSPPYASELEAYCASKAAALQAAEEFVRDKKPRFDLISMMPSWVFGADERAASTAEVNLSTAVLVSGLLSSDPGEPAIGNAVLNSDVARAHVRALDEDVEGNQAFVLNVDVRWGDTTPVAQKYFPEAFASGFFREGKRRGTIVPNWHSSKTRDILGIDFASYEMMVKETVGQYLDLAKKEGRC